MTVKGIRSVTAGVASAMLVGAAAQVQAAGFALYETSAKGNAMGGAVVGRTDDASAVQANPANMTDKRDFQSMVGLTAIGPSGNIDTPAGSFKLSDQWFTPPHAYATWNVCDDLWLGAGLYSEFGMGTRYAGNWAGRYNSLETSLETLTVSPTIAYKVFDKLSVGAGFRAMYVDFANSRLQRLTEPTLIPIFGETLGRTAVKGTGWGFGWLAGVKYEVTDDLDIGAVYRSRVRVNVTGEGWLDSYLPILPSQAASADAVVTLPSSATIGANYYLLERALNLGAAVTWTEWSTYDALNITFNRPLVASNPASDQSNNEKDWRDAWRFGTGACYSLTENISLMAGYVYDRCPISKTHTDFMMPAGDRHIFGIGAGYALKNWFVNVSYNYLIMAENTRMVQNGSDTDWLRAKFTGMDAHIFGLSTGLTF